MIFFMLWHRTNSSVLITKFLKIPRIVNAIILRKFKNLFSWFEIEISSFSSFFPLFSLSSFFHLHFWLSVIIRTTLWQDYMNNPSNINKIRPIETKGAGELQPPTPPPPPHPQIFATFHFSWIEKNSVKVKNSSKVTDISNITIDLDTRDGILSVIYCERFSHF